MEAMDEAFATALPGAAMEAAPAITQLLAMVTLAAATHPSVLGVMAVAATHPLFLVVAMAMLWLQHRLLPANRLWQWLHLWWPSLHLLPALRLQQLWIPAWQHLL